MIMLQTHCGVYVQVIIIDMERQEDLGVVQTGERSSVDSLNKMRVKCHTKVLGYKIFSFIFLRVMIDMMLTYSIDT